MSQPPTTELWEFGADPAPAKPTAPSSAAQLTPREVTCDVEYTIPATGEVKTCAIILRLLSNADRITAAQQVALMCGGQPIECFEEGHRAWLQAWAHMGRLVTKDWPEWLLAAIKEDQALLFALYGEALAHQERYFLRDTGEGAGAPSKPRMAVRARLPPKPPAPK